MSVFAVNDPETSAAGLDAAATALASGELVVLPTDTVYGLAADAFSPAAVEGLLEAKGRDRTMPPPVLIADRAVLNALAIEVSEAVERLAAAYWPGPLTLICRAQPSLAWDLGETRGTVALRMPDDEAALALLKRTGPLAVSSANISGSPAATNLTEAAVMLGSKVSVYLDGGPSVLGASSTIIDATVDPPEIVREGALSREAIVARLGPIFGAPERPDGTSSDGTSPDGFAPEESRPDDPASP